MVGVLLYVCVVVGCVWCRLPRNHACCHAARPAVLPFDVVNACCDAHCSTSRLLPLLFSLRTSTCCPFLPRVVFFFLAQNQLQTPNNY
jgi:hypothetical protein